MKVYLDNAATTPVDKQVLEAMMPYFSDTFGNASSLHSFGQQSAKAVEEARKKIAKFFQLKAGPPLAENCQPDEIIFTSGATEADNLAVRGVVGDKQNVHIITTAIEHPAVLEVCKELEKIGVEVSYVKPGKDGVVRVEDIKKEIKDNTILISVMYVNNEIGTVQPIQEIGEMIKNQKIKKSKNQKNTSRYPLFHVDAVQAVNYCNMDVKKLGVDLLSISGHKIYGPKGIGALYVKKPARNATPARQPDGSHGGGHNVAGGDTPLKPIQFGGHHEQGLRPGTLNVPGIVGLGKAIELITSRDNQKIKSLRDYLWQQIQKDISGVKLNGDLEKRAPNNLNISFKGVEGESLMLDLDMQGIAVSTGSACSSGSLEPSHVLMAINLSHEDSHGSLRITLGKDNTKQEIDYFVEKLIASVEKFRKIAPDLTK